MEVVHPHLGSPSWRWLQWLNDQREFSSPTAVEQGRAYAAVGSAALATGLTHKSALPALTTSALRAEVSIEAVNDVDTHLAAVDGF